MDIPALGPVDAVVLAIAAAAAGAVNAVAGGGSLISFPALLALGYPAVVANVTNTVALTPGYLGGTVGYRQELSGQRRRAIALGVTSVVGAIAGSALLLVSPASVFELLVPWLILLACGLLTVQEPVGRMVERRRAGTSGGSGGPGVVLHVAQLAAATYGAYFGAGLGIMLLAVLGILVADELQRLNALKGLLSLVINVVGAVYFAVFADVVWLAVVIMAVSSLVGGRIGVALARRLNDRVLRWLVVAFGVAVAVQLFVGG